MPKQTHLFATRADLEPGLHAIESRAELKYARCDLYDGPIFEQLSSLLKWDGLGTNVTGNHMTGARFLVVRTDCKINLEEVPQVSTSLSEGERVWRVDPAGFLSQSATFTQEISRLDKARELHPKTPLKYSLSQKLNPDSIIFSPGGLYKEHGVLICGHVGTASKSYLSQRLYAQFVRTITAGFERVGSYRVGPEAAKLMDCGYRMVTVGISSPKEYDLRRSTRTDASRKGRKGDIQDR